MAPTTTKSTSETLTIPNPNYEIHRIGDLYDSDNCNFSSVNLFRKSLPAEFIKTENLYSVSETQIEQCLPPVQEAQIDEAYEVLRRPTFGRMNQPSEEAKEEPVDEEQSVENEIQTVKEWLDQPIESLTPYVDQQALKYGTHYVRGITWGATFRMTAFRKSTKSKEKTADDENKLKRMFKSVFGTTKQTESMEVTNKYSVKFEGDGIFETPKNMEDAEEVAQNLMKNLKGNKGRQVLYTLEPIPENKPQKQEFSAFEIMLFFTLVAILLQLLVLYWRRQSENLEIDQTGSMNENGRDELQFQ